MGTRRRRARPARRGLRRREDRHRGALLRHRRARGRRARRSTPSTRTGSLPLRTATTAPPQPVPAPARPREPVAHRARPLRRPGRSGSRRSRKLREGVWGIRPRNKEQHFALDLLLDDDIKLVTLVGKAGTGKTLLAIAAGLQKVVEERRLPQAAGARARSSRSAATSATCPATSRRSSTPGCSRSSTTSSCSSASRKGEQEGRAAATSELIDLGYIADRAAHLHPRPLASRTSS